MSLNPSLSTTLLYWAATISSRWLPVHPGSGKLKLVGQRKMFPVVCPCLTGSVVCEVAEESPDFGTPFTTFPFLVTHTAAKQAFALRLYVIELAVPSPASFKLTT